MQRYQKCLKMITATFCGEMMIKMRFNDVYHRGFIKVRDKRAVWQHARPLYLNNFPSLSYSCSLRLSHSVSPNRCEDLVSRGRSGGMSYPYVLASLMEATDSDICFQGRAYRKPSTSK